MISDGNVLVIRQQRIVGTKQLADIRGVEDRGVEIGVVADDRGQQHLDIGLRNQMTRERSVDRTRAHPDAREHEDAGARRAEDRIARP